MSRDKPTGSERQDSGEHGGDAAGAGDDEVGGDHLGEAAGDDDGKALAGGEAGGDEAEGLGAEQVRDGRDEGDVGGQLVCGGGAAERPERGGGGQAGTESAEDE